MRIKKNVVIPTNIGRSKLGETSLAVMEFAESEDANMKFECDDPKEAVKVYSTVSGFVNRYHMNLRVTKSMNDVYVIRK